MHLLRAAGRNDRGSVAAELALALPAVVLTLLLGAGALGAASRQVSLQDAAADAARLLGRGEDISTARHVVQNGVAGASISTRTEQGLICVTAQVTVSVGTVIRLPLDATSCALEGGL